MARIDYKYEEELIETSKKLVAPGKGILAADESESTIGSRFKDISVENTAENRKKYRKALFSAKGLSEHISGTILFDETARDKELTTLLKEQGIIIGIKVDKGTRAMPLSTGFLFTQGLTDLDKRCEEYYSLGCRFAKWRAVLKIKNASIPHESIFETARTLARYAATCQQYGLVPIVEPEILMDGPHCIGQCRRWTTKVLAEVMAQLSFNNVLMEGMLLKVNMVLPGSENKLNRTHEGNAKATIAALRRTLPPAVPGVTFLSGGQSETDATMNLNEMNKGEKQPWALTFSYGRALQRSALQAWGGKDENIEKLQNALLERAKANGQASLGKYEGGAKGNNESLFQAGYSY